MFKLIFALIAFITANYSFSVTVSLGGKDYSEFRKYCQVEKNGRFVQNNFEGESSHAFCYCRTRKIAPFEYCFDDNVKFKKVYDIISPLLGKKNKTVKDKYDLAVKALKDSGFESRFCDYSWMNYTRKLAIDGDDAIKANKGEYCNENYAKLLNVLDAKVKASDNELSEFIKLLDFFNDRIFNIISNTGGVFKYLNPTKSEDACRKNENHVISNTINDVYAKLSGDEQDREDLFISFQRPTEAKSEFDKIVDSLSFERHNMAFRAILDIIKKNEKK